MDNYHIFGRIGTGNFSEVFKGRQKKSIEYVAIKRIDKSRMDIIVHEARILHKLKNPHILKFHDWYQTSNNLWLIIEYCTGGDLEKLLREDGSLSEVSIRAFGRDLIAGLKPKNILIDEFGILKIADLKHAREIPKSINDTSLLLSLSSESNSNLKYMAPELLTSEGTPSFASDLWSLGCLLLELRLGFHPYGINLNSNNTATSIKTIIQCIKTSRPWESTLLPGFPNILSGSSSQQEVSSSERARRDANQPNQLSTTSMSTLMQDLISWMMEWDPIDRCSWNDTSSHPFWRQYASSAQAPSAVSSSKPLPPEPAFEEFVRIRHQIRIKEIHDQVGRDLRVSAEELKQLEVKAQSLRYTADTLKLPTHVGITPLKHCHSLNTFIDSSQESIVATNSSPYALNYNQIHSQSQASTVATVAPLTLASTPVGNVMPASRSTTPGDAHTERKISQTSLLVTPDSVESVSSQVRKSNKSDVSPNKSQMLDESRMNTPVGHVDSTSAIRHYNVPSPITDDDATPKAVFAGVADTKNTVFTWNHPAEKDSPGLIGRRESNASAYPIDSVMSNSSQIMSPVPPSRNDNNNESANGLSCRIVQSSTPNLLTQSQASSKQSISGSQSPVKRGIKQNASTQHLNNPKQPQHDDQYEQLFDKAKSSTSPMQVYRPCQNETQEIDNGLFDPLKLIMHSADYQVKQIVNNPLIEIINLPQYKSAPLLVHFPVHTADSASKLPPAALEFHLKMVCKALAKCTPSSPTHHSNPSTQSIGFQNAHLLERANILAYILSISSIQKVADFILSSRFVGYLLRTMKQTTSGGLPSSTSPASITSRTMQPNVGTTLNVCRVLASTILAFVFRFALHIPPPSLPYKEDSIIPTLVQLLTDDGNDTTLRRRVLGALGELIFYISAQNDTSRVASANTSANTSPRVTMTPSKSISGTAPLNALLTPTSIGGAAAATDLEWEIPQYALNAVFNCLNDDTDEVVIHYAAKTIENVIAQGNLKYKAKLISKDVAKRLMHLSRTAKNKSLRATCAMTTSHIFYVVSTQPSSVWAPRTFSSPQQPSRRSSSSGQASGIDQRSGSHKSGVTTYATSGSSHPTPESDYTSRTATDALGSLFITAVLESFEMSAFNNVFHQDSLKLQQAYLNILNIIFNRFQLKPSLKDSMSDIRLDDSSELDADALALRSLRSYFIKLPGFTLTLCKLINQGLTSSIGDDRSKHQLIIRAKSFVAIQLMCRLSSSLLLSFAEKRLSTLLYKNIEPILMISQNKLLHSKDFQYSPVLYCFQAAFSTILYIQNITVQSMHCIKQQYERVKNESSRMEYDNVDFTLIKKANTVLDAFAILTSNPPTIRKLLICSRYQFCNLLEGLDSAYSMITSTRKLIFSTLKKSTSSREIPLPSSDISTDNLGTVKSGSAEAGEVLIATETCLVACIEVFAQMEFANLEQLRPAASSVAIIEKYLPTQLSYFHFIDKLLSHYIPISIAMMKHSDRNIRISVLSCLRSTLPNMLRLLTTMAGDPSTMNAIRFCTSTAQSSHSPSSPTYPTLSNLLETLAHPTSIFASISAKLPRLLHDNAPLPQYTINLMRQSLLRAPVRYAQQLVSMWHENESTQILIHLMRPPINTVSDIARSNDETEVDYVDDSATHLDPHLFQLLCLILELSKIEYIDDNFQGRNIYYNNRAHDISLIPLKLLDLGICDALAASIFHVTELLGSSTDLGKSAVDLEICSNVVELMRIILSISFSRFSDLQSKVATVVGNVAERTEVMSKINQIMKGTKPIQPTLPLLLQTLASICKALDCEEFNDNPRKSFGNFVPLLDDAEGNLKDDSREDSAMEIALRMSHSIAQCLELLFELHPEIVVSKLLQENAQDHAVTSTGTLSDLIAEILTSKQSVAGNVVAKILLGSVKVAPHLKKQEEFKILLLKPSRLKNAVATILSSPQSEDQSIATVHNLIELTMQAGTTNSY